MPTGTQNTQGSALLPQNNGGQNAGLTLGQQVLPPVAINFGATLPSIPNPTPPPPKQLTVVTPKLAQADLAQKKETTDQVALASQAQTQTKLAAMGAPAVQQLQNGQPQQANGQQNTPQQPQQPTQTTPPPNATAVTLPNGVQAYYDNDTKQLTTTDGKQLQYNQQTGSWLDPTTGQPPAPQGTTGNTQLAVPTTGDPTTDYVNQQLSQNQQQADLASASHQAQLAQILNGTFPLTADQQAQVTGLQSQLDQLRGLQENANKNYVDATTILGIRSGAQQYSPAFAQGQITQAITQGTQKLAQLDIQASSSVAALKEGFMKDDYDMINGAYKDLTDAVQAKNDTLTKMQDNVTKAVAAQTAKIQNDTAALANQTAAINSVAQSALQQALKADGTLDLDAIQSIADADGVDANALYGAVQKAQQAETLFAQGDSKFASDQLQAAATLANTKANTAKTYNDISNANKAAAGTAPDVTGLSTDAQAKLKANGFTGFNTGTQGLAISLVTGQLAPSELSKRTTGTSSYSDVLNAANAYAQATTGKPFNIAQADRDYKYATNVATQNTLNYLGSLVGSDDGNGNLQGGNLDELVNQSNAISRTSFPALNNTEAWAKLETGDPAIASYYATATEVSDQVAKILQGGGSGSGTSDAKLAQASALFQKGFTKDQIQGVANTLKDLLQNRAQGIVGNNPYLSDYADQFGIQQDNGLPGQTDTGKGGQTDNQFVESTLEAQGLSYDAVKAKIPAGQKGVINNKTGQIGSIPESEYDPSIYTSL